MSLTNHAWRSIQQPLERYLDTAERTIEQVMGTAPKHVEIPWPARVRTAVEDAEETDAFAGLVASCHSEIDAPTGRFYSAPIKEKSWSDAMKNFFRNAGVYLRMARQEPVSATSVLEQFAAEVARIDCEVTYLALLDGISLAQSEVQFGDFQLKHLDINQLEKRLNGLARAVFWPHTMAGVDRLAGHYFLIATEKVPTGLKGLLQLADLGLSNLVRQRPTRLPAELERGLRTLALYDWQPRWTGDDQKRETEKQFGWQGFNVPGVLALRKDLLAVPRVLPTAEIDVEPVLDEHGEEIGLKPVTPHIALNDSETAKVDVFLNRMSACLDRVFAQEDASQFIEVSTDFLLKGLLSPGIEQLLWHITAIEGIIGEQKETESLSSILRRRLGRILADTKNGRKRIRNRFKKLYNFRSRLVHGDKGDLEIYKGHLAEARHFARATVCWGIRAFDHLLQKSKEMEEPGEYAPQREDLLRLLDLDEEERNRLSAQTFWLPDDFPCITDWTD